MPRTSDEKQLRFLRIIYPYMPNDMVLDLYNANTKYKLTKFGLRIRTSRMKLRKRLADVGGDDETEETPEQYIEDYEEAIAVYSYVHDIALHDHVITFTDTEWDTNMTDKEVLAEMQSDSILNEVRKALSGIVGMFEQENMQRHKPSIFDMRRMEFAAAQKLIDIVRRRIVD